MTKPEPQRNDAITIAMAEEKTKADKSGQYYRIKTADGTWYSCFEYPLNPVPAAGQVWACNIKQKGEWTNLHDMMIVTKEGTAVLAPQQPAQPEQPPVTHQNVQGGPDRQVSIVRQSSLRSAASCMMIDMTRPLESAKDVLKVAEMFYDWAQR